MSRMWRKRMERNLAYQSKKKVKKTGLLLPIYLGWLLAYSFLPSVK
jgi:hypothetical protein